MAKGIAMSALRDFLHEFVEDMDEEQLNVSLVGDLFSESNINLTDVFLRTGYFNALGLPVELVGVYVGKARITNLGSLVALSSEALEATVENVMILLAPPSSTSASLDEIAAARMLFFDLAERFITGYPREFFAEVICKLLPQAAFAKKVQKRGDQAAQRSTAKWIRWALEKVSVTVRNVHVRFELPRGNDADPVDALGLMVPLIRVNSTAGPPTPSRWEGWRSGAARAAGGLVKQVALSGVQVYGDTSVVSYVACMTSTRERRHAMLRSFRDRWATERHTGLLLPLSVQCSLTLRDEGGDGMRWEVCGVEITTDGSGVRAAIDHEQIAVIRKVLASLVRFNSSRRHRRHLLNVLEPRHDAPHLNRSEEDGAAASPVLVRSVSVAETPGVLRDYLTQVAGSGAASPPRHGDRDGVRRDGSRVKAPGKRPPAQPRRPMPRQAADRDVLRAHSTGGGIVRGADVDSILLRVPVGGSEEGGTCMPPTGSSQGVSGVGWARMAWWYAFVCVRRSLRKARCDPLARLLHLHRERQEYLRLFSASLRPLGHDRFSTLPLPESQTYDALLQAADVSRLSHRERWRLAALELTIPMDQVLLYRQIARAEAVLRHTQAIWIAENGLPKCGASEVFDALRKPQQAVTSADGSSVTLSLGPGRCVSFSSSPESWIMLLAPLARWKACIYAAHDRRCAWHGALKGWGAEPVAGVQSAPPQRSSGEEDMTSPGHRGMESPSLFSQVFRSPFGSSGKSGTGAAEREARSAGEEARRPDRRPPVSPASPTAAEARSGGGIAASRKDPRWPLLQVSVPKVVLEVRMPRSADAVTSRGMLLSIAYDTVTVSRARLDGRGTVFEVRVGGLLISHDVELKGSRHFLASGGSGGTSSAPPGDPRGTRAAAAFAMTVERRASDDGIAGDDAWEVLVSASTVELTVNALCAEPIQAAGDVADGLIARSCEAPAQQDARLSPGDATAIAGSGFVGLMRTVSLVSASASDSLFVDLLGQSARVTASTEQEVDRLYSPTALRRFLRPERQAVVRWSEAVAARLPRVLSARAHLGGVALTSTLDVCGGLETGEGLEDSCVDLSAAILPQSLCLDLSERDGKCRVDIEALGLKARLQSPAKAIALLIGRVLAAASATVGLATA